jgi:4-hydroxybenzoate polyprenyltransferase
METRRQRRFGDILVGLYLLIHPLPVLFHTLAIILFVLLASWPHFLGGTILLVIAAHTAMQCSIAILNDYCDRDLDRLSKRHKPIAQGLIRPQEALVLGLLAIVLMVLLLLPLNPLALVLSLIYLLLGLGYNLGLKSTPLSGVVFALAIPLIPVYAFVGVGHFTPFLFWFVPIGALLGVSLNLANSLPDIETDAAHKAHTLAVVLGVRGTLIICPSLIGFALILTCTLAFTQLVTTRVTIFALTVIVTSLLLVGSIILSLFMVNPVSAAQRNSQLCRIYFLLVVCTCLLFVGGWLISVI